MTLFEPKEHKIWFKRCKSILLNSDNLNPFPKPPIAVNYYNNPPFFCIGRDNQLDEIINEITNSISSFHPQLIRVMGKQGIGKSTLICWAVKKLNNTYSIPVVYLETSAQPDDFKMRSLYRQIVSKIEKTPTIKTLLLNTIIKFITIFRDKGGKLYKGLSNKFSGEVIRKLIENPEYILENIKEPTFTQKILDLLSDNAILLKESIPVDLNFLQIFWKAHTQNPDYLISLNAFKGNTSYGGFNITTDNDASKYIDEIIELYRWAFSENTTLVLIIDHLEAGISQQKESIYSNLFSLLLNLRHKKFITIILSGTLDAYSVFHNVLQEDQRLQLDNWSKTIALTSIESNNVIRIINKYLQVFWNNYNFEPPPKYALFPFGENSLKYLYENNGLDLRKTLKNLYELIEEYRKSNELEHIDNFFQAFKIFRQRDDVALSFIEQKELRAMLLDSSIQDKFRSTIVEKGICQFFKVLANHPDYDYLTDVLHEPPLGRSKKKPDIFLEFFGREGPEFIRKLGIEVKIYRKGTEISKSDIEKTYLLLKEHALDYVTWITNVPLDIKHRYHLPEELYVNLGRISPLNGLELAYVSFITQFTKIYERDPTIEEVEYILNKIDLSPIKLREKLKFLPKLTDIPEKIKKLIDLTPFTSRQKVQEELPPKEIVPEIRSSAPLKSIELAPEQIKTTVKKFIEDKSKTNKQTTSASTIKAVRRVLNLEEGDTKWNEDIWMYAINISKSLGLRHTPKTIYFR
ncbi:MAG: hypothetical protein ACTSR7_17855 [Promethearchaeota archaeon]